MHKSCLLLACAAIFCAARIFGEEDVHEKTAKEVIAQLKELNSILATVQDGPSAKAAQPKLEALGKKIRELSKASKELPKLSEAQEEELRKKYEDQLTQENKTLMDEMLRISQNPDLAEELQTALRGGEKPAPRAKPKPNLFKEGVALEPIDAYMAAKEEGKALESAGQALEEKDLAGAAKKYEEALKLYDKALDTAAEILGSGKKYPGYEKDAVELNQLRTRAMNRLEAAKNKLEREAKQK
jgi:hypothetical protein